MVYKTKVKSNKRDQEEIMTISRPCKYYPADTQQLLLPHSLLEMVLAVMQSDSLWRSGQLKATSCKTGHACISIYPVVPKTTKDYPVAHLKTYILEQPKTTQLHNQVAKPHRLCITAYGWRTRCLVV